MDNLNGWDGLVEDWGTDGIFVDQRALGFLKGAKGWFYNMDNELNHLRAYNECSPLKAVVNKRSKAFNTGIITIVNKNTGKPASGTQALQDKLNQPNPLQTGKQFRSQQNIYLDIFGWCPVFITRPVGYDNDITNIWNIPPWLLDIEYTNSWLYQTKVEDIYKGFKMKWLGSNVTLAANNLTIMFDDGFGTDMDMNLTIPDSRLKSLEYDISNIVTSNIALHTMTTKKGAIGILTDEGHKDVSGHIPMDPSEKENVQNEFKRYGIVGQEWQVIISQANLKWQSMTVPVRDLMLHETQQNAIMRICDQYSYPYRLLSSEKSASYNDVREFSKIFYQETVIPESESRIEQFAKAIFRNKESNLTLKIDFSHVYVLQDDKQQSATARKTLDEALEREFKNNVITLDEWRIAAGIEPKNDDAGQMYYYELIAEGYAFGSVTSSNTQGQQAPTDSTENETPMQVVA